MKNILKINVRGLSLCMWINLILTGSMLFITSCTKSDNTTEKNLKIGVLAPLTGSISSTGESAQAALSLAMEDVNNYLRASGSEERVNFLINDTKTDTAVTLQVLKTYYDQGIRFVIGPYTSANAAAVLDFANKYGIILLSPSSVATTLSIAGDNLFRLVPDDSNQAEAIAALFSHDDVDHIIPIVRNDIWGNGLISGVMQLLAAQNKTVITPILFDPSNVDAAGIISQVSTAIIQTLQQAPASKTAVYLLSFGEGTSILSAASASSECALVHWYGSSAFATNASLVLDPAASSFAYQQSLRCPIFAPDAAAKDKWQPIVTKLTNTLGRIPEAYALTTYDAVWLMALAYRDCSDPKNLALFKSSLIETANLFYGITGRTTLNDAGDRKFATFGFWGISLDGSAYNWKEYGNYSNSTGQLVIY